MSRIDEMRRVATIKEHEIENTEATDFPGNFPGYDDHWDFDRFSRNFSIKIVEMQTNCMEFDMIGLNPAIANAFRRILIAEVPTMAIEKVFVSNNTSLFQDEFLAHRLGLIPIKVDPRVFEYRQEGDEEGTPQDTIVLSLKTKCSKSKETKDQNEQIINRMVYTSDIVWESIGNQAELFRDDPIGPVDNDILIAKLSPGQELDLKMHCVKGIGKDHAKFSPVSNASYRLLPEIKLLKEFDGETAEKLKKCFSEGVIDLVKKKNKLLAKVVNSRLDSGSRNFLRYPEFKDFVQMNLVKNHFIFTIESTGILPSNQLMVESVDILIGKCKRFIKEIQEYRKKMDEIE